MAALAKEKFIFCFLRTNFVKALMPPCGVLEQKLSTRGHHEENTTFTLHSVFRYVLCWIFIIVRVC